MPNIKRKIALLATNTVLAGTRPWTFPLKRAILNWGGYSIGQNSSIVGPIYVTGTLAVGDNSWVGKNLTVNGNGIVKIGNNCAIAPEVTFQTGGHRIGNHAHRAGEGCSHTQIVGNGVWIGVRVTILNDIEIHDGSVIAGGACVVKDVEEDVLVGGVPAKIIRHLK